MGARSAEYIGKTARGDVARLSVEIDAQEALADEGQSPLTGRWIQVLPFGQSIQARDGRKFTIQDAHEVVKNTELPLLIDRDHQSVDGESLAAGWIEELQVRDGDGVWGRAAWTPKGAEQVKSREFRFLSPVVLGKRDAGLFHVKKLGSVALTNTPALKMAGIEMFREQLSHRFGAFITEEQPMSKLKAVLCSALGLGTDASDDAVESAALARITKQGSDESASLRVVVDTLTKERNEATEELSAVRKELDGFKSVAFKRDVEVFFDKGAREGRIPPAAREKWLAFAMKSEQDFETFKEVVYPGLPKVAPTERAQLSTKRGKKGELTGKNPETGVDYDALRAIGMTDEQIRASESEVFRTKKRDPGLGPDDDDDDDDDSLSDGEQRDGAQEGG
jgi:phage I-like protein